MNVVVLVRVVLLVVLTVMVVEVVLIEVLVVLWWCYCECFKAGVMVVVFVVLLVLGVVLIQVAVLTEVMVLGVSSNVGVMVFLVLIVTVLELVLSTRYGVGCDGVTGDHNTYLTHITMEIKLTSHLLLKSVFRKRLTDVMP